MSETHHSGRSGNGQTFFAPAERASAEQLGECVRLASDNAVIDAVLNGLGGVVAILNQQRQIVAVNSALLRRIGVSDPEALLGLRPGEAFQCRHAAAAPSGCGTGRACRDCGAAIAIVLCAREGAPVERECLLTTQRNGQLVSMEFLVRATPTLVDAVPFTVVLLQDISDRKRRDALERVFFHDILNSMSALQSYAELLRKETPGNHATVVAELSLVVNRLVAEVQTHRDLAAAERGDYRLRLRNVAALDILTQLQSFALGLEAARGKALEVIADPHEHLVTDPSLLLRVLTNMVKNGLEAVTAGAAVRVRCDADSDCVTFRVWNPGGMDERTALRVFQRSFTTKSGTGRGLGTYSMKLFGEQYLGGEVDFSTSVEQGTEFFVRLPRSAPGAT